MVKRPKIPPLLGAKELAETLEVDPKNMHHYRKKKSFPEPITYVGDRPLWLESEVLEYKDGIGIRKYSKQQS